MGLSFLKFVLLKVPMKTSICQWTRNRWFPTWYKWNLSPSLLSPSSLAVDIWNILSWLGAVRRPSCITFVSSPMLKIWIMRFHLHRCQVSEKMVNRGIHLRVFWGPYHSTVVHSSTFPAGSWRWRRNSRENETNEQITDSDPKYEWLFVEGLV